MHRLENGRAPLPARLRDVLYRTRELCGPHFSGVGVVVTDSPELLPIMSLRSSKPSSGFDDTASLLATISVASSEFHDGFHVLNSDLQFILVSQYFSPPICAQVKIDRTKLFGGRYVAGLMGSMLPKVLVAGVASRESGISVFEHGIETFSEQAK